MAALRATKELMAQLAKADESDADRCIDLIAALAAVHMSYEVLAESKVGNLVKPLKKAASAKLAAAAAALLKSWRAIADQHASAVILTGFAFGGGVRKGGHENCAWCCGHALLFSLSLFLTSLP